MIRSDEKKVVLASNNPGKIREIQAILNERLIVPQSELALPEANETGLTFVENAIIKARNAAHYCGLSAIADDSGLEVDALSGAPGVHSARYAGDGASDQRNIEKLLDEMADIPDDQRTARFRCIIVYLRHEQDPCPLIAQGTWEGVIVRESRGSEGFGYDPVFLVPEEGCTSAELRPERKNRLSHRGKALRELARML
jgi:XTP/dITP diphosphohydrolase